MQAALLFPHHLFEDLDPLAQCQKVILFEAPLYFTQFKFHKQKLILHRASMQAYAHYLKEQGKQVDYIPFHRYKNTSELLGVLKLEGIAELRVYEPSDFLLRKALDKAMVRSLLHIEFLDSPLFLNSLSEIKTSLKKPYFMASFYREERIKRGILLTPEGKPEGGKWSFDAENRKKLPKGTPVPAPKRFGQNQWVEEAKTYVKQHFADNPGEAESFAYPVTFKESEEAFADFLERRFFAFGDYEDALHPAYDYLFHSVLTPYLNIGLITPVEVVKKALDFASAHSIPLNTLEGFIRQVIGWREFMRGIYELEGVKQRNSNFFAFQANLDERFYSGTTSMLPLDDVIKKVQRTAYAHHIERLMVVGNYFLLRETDPHEVYRWFMELFIDAYDWVMVPNVYGMSQYADGGLITTKPYFSGSNYLLKMSPYAKAAWSEKWDDLYWRHMLVYGHRYTKNPRMGMMLNLANKLADERKKALLSLQLD